MRMQIVLSLAVFGSAFLLQTTPPMQQNKRVYTEAEKRMILYTKSRGHLEAAPLPVPDSLGGKSMIGAISLDVCVAKDGSLHGYQVGRIEISPDTLHWFVYSRNRSHPWGDSLLAEFRPWLDRYYQGMHAVDTEKDSLFLLSDTLWYNTYMEFGYPLSKDAAKRFGKPIYRGGRIGE